MIGTITPQEQTARHRIGLAEILLVAAAAYASFELCDEWLAIPAVATLWAIWRFMPAPDGPPVLAMALTFQWVQVTVGIFYYAVSGRTLPVMFLTEYRPMVMIGLGCIVALIVGIRAGSALFLRRSDRIASMPLPLTLRGLTGWYLLSLTLEGSITQLAWDQPDLTQAILAFNFVHRAMVFLLLRRLSRPYFHWYAIGALLTFETLLGFTGFFAGFRDPLVLTGIVLAESFNPKAIRHWVAAAALFIAAIALGVAWISVRGEYRAEYYSDLIGKSREERLLRVFELTQGLQQQERWQILENVDVFVERMWAIYYPALAVGRVPTLIPHTEGELTMTAVRHILSPRIFFPEKAQLQSDSELVRKYSGVLVAGTEQDTSIAFGYAAEAYIDFGVPGMFVPVLAWGLFIGAAFGFFMRSIRVYELRLGFMTVVFWLSLYLFERSWAKSLGLAGTLMIYLGAATFVLDQYVVRYFLPARVAAKRASMTSPEVSLDSRGPR